MRVLPLLIGALALAACAPTPSALTDLTPPLRQCDASASQALIGSHIGAVDFAAGANVRIVCTTCPTTRDYRPDRVNIRFDQATGIIKVVDCG